MEWTAVIKEDIDTTISGIYVHLFLDHMFVDKDEELCGLILESIKEHVRS